MGLEERMTKIDEAILIMKDLLARHDDQRMEDHYRPLQESREDFEFKLRESREDFSFKMNAVIALRSNLVKRRRRTRPRSAS